MGYIKKSSNLELKKLKKLTKKLKKIIKFTTYSGRVFLIFIGF